MKHVKVYEDFVNESKAVNESKVTITKLNPTTFRLEVDSKFGQTTLTAGSEKEAGEMKSKIEKAFKDGKIHNIGGIGAAVYEESVNEGAVVAKKKFPADETEAGEDAFEWLMDALDKLEDFEVSDDEQEQMREATPEEVASFVDGLLKNHKIDTKSLGRQVEIIVMKK